MSSAKRAKRSTTTPKLNMIADVSQVNEGDDTHRFNAAIQAATGTIDVLVHGWGEKSFVTSAARVVTNARTQDGSAFAVHGSVDDANGRLAGCSAAFCLTTFGFHEHDVKAGAGQKFFPFGSHNVDVSGFEWGHSPPPAFAKEIEKMLCVREYYAAFDFNLDTIPIVTMCVRARVPEKVVDGKVICPACSIAVPLSDDQRIVLRKALPSALSLLGAELPSVITPFLRTK